MEYVEPIETGAIISPELLQWVKFDITSAMMLNLKVLFDGLPTDDGNMHIINFVGICTSYNLSRVSQEALRLRLFLFSLT